MAIRNRLKVELAADAAGTPMMIVGIFGTGVIKKYLSEEEADKLQHLLNTQASSENPLDNLSMKGLQKTKEE